MLVPAGPPPRAGRTLGWGWEATRQALQQSRPAAEPPCTWPGETGLSRWQAGLAAPVAGGTLAQEGREVASRGGEELGGAAAIGLASLPVEGPALLTVAPQRAGPGCQGSWVARETGESGALWPRLAGALSGRGSGQG